MGAADPRSAVSRSVTKLLRKLWYCVKQLIMSAYNPPRSRRSHRGLKRGVRAASLLLLAAWLGGCTAADPLTPPLAPPPAPPPQTRPVMCGRPGFCSGETAGLRDTNELHEVCA